MTQGVQGIGHMLRGAKINFAFHAQQFELRAFGKYRRRCALGIIEHHKLPIWPPAIKAHGAHGGL